MKKNGTIIIPENMIRMIGNVRNYNKTQKLANTIAKALKSK